MPGAELRLADIWVSSRLRQSIREIVDRIDGLLSRHPGELGESRAGLERIAFDPPMGFSFFVLEEDKLVVVRDVSMY